MFWNLTFSYLLVNISFILVVVCIGGFRDSFHPPYRAVSTGPILSRLCIQPVCFTSTSVTFCRVLNCSSFSVRFATGIKFYRTFLNKTGYDLVVVARNILLKLYKKCRLCTVHWCP